MLLTGLQLITFALIRTDRLSDERSADAGTPPRAHTPWQLPTTAIVWPQLELSQHTGVHVYGSLCGIFGCRRGGRSRKQQGFGTESTDRAEI